MPSNDQYPDPHRSSFGPVGVVLVLALCGLLGVVLWVETTGEPGDRAPPIDRGLVPTQPSAASPPAPVP